MKSSSPQIKMEQDGRWRWYFADYFGNALFFSACSYRSRDEAERDFDLMLPVIAKNFTG
ncbi:MAG: hypothetical protein J0I80_07730 [Sphingomonas sp.]|nr:hypothetical protein [Sphingomonas sp.]